MTSDPVLDAVVVGSGPNGLVAAIELARAGHDVTVFEAADRIGGGTRSDDHLESGVIHDICSAVHPLGVGSPHLATLDLARHGLRWRWADVELAHPLDGGRAGVLHRSIARTAQELGDDGAAWRRAFGHLVDSFDAVAESVMRPIVSVHHGLPHHPVVLGRFGIQALQSASLFARRWDGDEARGLYGGIAAHAIQPLHRPTTAAVGSVLTSAGHAVGWPVAEGGSQRIADALAGLLVELGGTIETGVNVTGLDQLPPHRVAVLDVSPSAAVSIAGDRLDGRVARSLRRWRHGPAAFKVDLVVDGGVPWTNDACRRAGTVHCGGTFEEIAAGEAELHRGRMPERPFVLVAQQHLADPTRSNGDHHPVWAYAHVPHGYDGDVGATTDALFSQIERFAPGFRDRILAHDARGPSTLETYNPNYVGGDIATGANSPWQTIVRPRLAPDPYRLADDVVLCSAATPPGAGVHGMCGVHAARSARRLLRDR
jgi:phytoene dehydrogenase-like protein